MIAAEGHSPAARRGDLARGGVARGMGRPCVRAFDAM